VRFDTNRKPSLDRPPANVWRSRAMYVCRHCWQGFAPQPRSCTGQIPCVYLQVYLRPRCRSGRGAQACATSRVKEQRPPHPSVGTASSFTVAILAQGTLWADAPVQAFWQNSGLRHLIKARGGHARFASDDIATGPQRNVVGEGAARHGALRSTLGHISHLATPVFALASAYELRGKPDETHDRDRHMTETRPRVCRAHGDPAAASETARKRAGRRTLALEWDGRVQTWVIAATRRRPNH
jgi:hypothetical protein